MKNSLRTSLLLTGICCAMLPAASLFAQTAAPAAAPSATPSVSVSAAPAAPAAANAGEGKHGMGKMKEAMASLTPEERQQLLAARRKAQADPAVQAAAGDKKAHRRAMQEAMIKADPGVKAILEKMRENNPRRKDLKAI